MRAFTTTRAIRSAVLLALAATALAVPHSLVAAGWTLVVATTMLAGIRWAQHFEARYAKHGDRAWSVWLLLPSVGAIGATLLAREEWHIWTVVALAIVALPTIAVHAMFMGQRDKPEVLGGTGTAPTGPLRAIVAWLPIASALGVLTVLAAAGITDLLT